MEKKNINEVIANLSVEQLAGMIDHTFLKPFGNAENIEKLCAEARQYKFAMVAINAIRKTFRSVISISAT